MLSIRCLVGEKLTRPTSPSPLTGEGWGEGILFPFLSPSPSSPPAKGGEILGVIQTPCTSNVSSNLDKMG